MIDRVLAPSDPDWPVGLNDLQTVPARLWFQGSTLPRRPAVAVVGSRHPSVTGLAIARWIGLELGQRGYQVISGFAHGIDAAAHAGALDSGASTIAVLGCGTGIPYPRGHDALRHFVTQHGGILTEYPPGAEPTRWAFPRRNRIIAALADAVIVVEARARSGALSTARWAADLGREVLAVPGSLRNWQSVGTNALIRDGAQPYLSIEDVIDAVGTVPGIAEPDAAAGPVRPEATLSPDDRRIVAALNTDGVHPDDVGAFLEMPASELGARLTALELRGVVTTLPGGLVALASRI